MLIIEGLDEKMGERRPKKKKKSFETYACAKRMHNHLLKAYLFLFLFLLRKVFFLHSKNRNVLITKIKACKTL